ncbi:MAG: tetratricopeptide repeat protein, partial [Gemmatimonadales bacterium]
MATTTDAAVGPDQRHREQRLRLRAGLAHHQAGDYPAALQCYQEVLAQDPEQADALHLIGALALQMGEHALAISLLERAVVIDPRAPDFAINLGLAYQTTGELEKARASFERAVRLRPASPM